MSSGGQSAEVTEQQLQDSEWSKDSRLFGYSVVEGTAGVYIFYQETK